MSMKTSDEESAGKTLQGKGGVQGPAKATAEPLASNAATNDPASPESEPEDPLARIEGLDLRRVTPGMRRMYERMVRTEAALERFREMQEQGKAAGAEEPEDLLARIEGLDLRRVTPGMRKMTEQMLRIEAALERLERKR